MAVRNEADFPRGGVRKASKAKIQRKDKDLFQTEKGGQKAKKKRSKRSNAGKNRASSEITESEVEKAVQLEYVNLTPGMLILGSIQEIGDYDLQIALPGRLKGQVSIANISQQYKEKLERIADGDEDSDNEVSDLKVMFQEGQKVICKVLGVTKLDTRHQVSLTLSPNALHEIHTIHTIKKGMNLMAAVKSVEDHGYVMELGIKGATAFLPSKDAQEFIQTWKFQNPLGVGHLVPCVVTKLDVSDVSAVVKLSANPKKLQKARITDEMEVKVHTLIPGMQIDVTVEKELIDGLQVKFCDDLTGYVHVNHLRGPWDDLTSYFSDTAPIPATVLYVVPMTNHIYLTLKPSLLSSCPPNAPPGGWKTGEVLEGGAQVVEVTSRGALLKLGSEGEAKGFAAVKHCSDSVEVDARKLKEELTVGAVKSCRIFQFEYLEEIYVCSLKKSVLKSTLIRSEEAEVGQKVKAVVKSYLEQGGVIVSVKCGGGMTLDAFIPPDHLSDLPLSQPQRKFRIGERVQCRVLRSDRQRHRLHLTAKPSLVESDLPVVAEYEGARVGTVVLGCIFGIKKEGVLVHFYGDVKGWIPVSKLSSEHIESPEKHFYVGQTIKCQILRVNTLEKKMVLTCRIRKKHAKEEMHEDEVKDTQPITQPELQPAFGDSVTCEVSKTFSEGLQVIVKPTGAACFIQTMHLSDHAGLAPLLQATYRVGDSLEAICYNRGKSSWLTMKPSLRGFIEENQEDGLKSFEDLRTGLVLPGVVIKMLPYGVFLKVPMKDLAKWLLVPIRHLSNTYIESVESTNLQTHQTLFGNVVHIKSDTGAATLSAQLDKCWSGSVDSSAEFLQSYLKDWERILKHSWPEDDEMQKVVKHKLGKIVTGTLQKLSSLGALVRLSDGVNAIVTSHHLQGVDVKEGDQVKGVVLYVDVAEKCLEMSALPRILQRALKKKKEKFTKLQLNEKITGEVVIVKEDLALLSVEATGDLVYVPVRKHYNDLTPVTDQFQLGGNITVIVKSTEKNMLIGTVFDKMEKKDIMSLHIPMNYVHSPALKRKSEEIIAESVTKAKKKKRKQEDSSVEVENPEESLIETKTKKKKIKEDISRKMKNTVENLPETKKKNKNNNTVGEVASPVETEKKKLKRKESSEEVAGKKPKLEKKSQDVVPHLEMSSGFVWDQNISFSQFGDVMKEDESSGDEEETAKIKKLSKAEKRALAKEEERKIEETERNLMDGERNPETVEDFERLVLGSPDSSLCWTKYMAFLLQATEIEKARSVAKRALSTISFREEREKLNVWFALLSMENLYGTQETFNNAYAEALQANDALQVYKHVAGIFARSEKIQQAEQVYETMRKKFKASKDVWIDFGIFYFQQGMLDKGRKLMQRSLLSLPNKEHIEILSRFAQLEFKMGSPEIGKTMYEQILSTYPQRIDIWIVYVDVLIKAEDLDAARIVLEKATSQNLRPRKMKSLFKKFLDFERKFGTPATQKKVQERALQYVESKEETSKDV